MRRWLGPLALGALTALAVYLLAMLLAPTLLMDRAWSRLASVGQANAMMHAPRVDARRQVIVRPSPDLAYSSCPFDLDQGPLRVHVEPVQDHYWSLTVFDDATNVVFVESDRENGERPIDLVLALPGQDTPAGARRIDMPSTKGIALIRVLLKDPAEFDTVAAVRQRSSCAPL